ncbi:unnamed protein product [Anisakis simplex]|uniref:Phosphatidylinositol transfer protein N-terminal domain-containing protein n=1 Tax=Anisakis simplex TaxID=6269 RepID=A0A3P6SVP5_ANISI|nr:unnamed protein product [Anisakis simplex]
MPMTVDEYQVGQLWSVAEASKAETGGGEGVEVLKNEPFTDVPLLGGRFSQGQYTHKIYHLQSKVPSILRKIAPKGSLAIHEEAWNAYPYCKTVLTNPDYMKENFFIKIESMHLPDRGTTKNAHGLSDDELANREVVYINIANNNEFLSNADIKPETSPALFKSKKTNRGPLTGDWRSTVEPVMCAYKLVTVYFKWFGFQKLVESFAHSVCFNSLFCFHSFLIVTQAASMRSVLSEIYEEFIAIMFKQYPRLFSKFHREVFCWIDNWYGLTMADIRAIEEKAQKELDEVSVRPSIIVLFDYHRYLFMHLMQLS